MVWLPFLLLPRLEFLLQHWPFSSYSASRKPVNLSYNDSDVLGDSVCGQYPKVGLMLLV